jgi:hypothetical protein
MKLRAATVFGLASLLWSCAARADFEIHYPVIDYREFELEHNGSTSIDSRGALNNNQSYTVELGYGVTPWWEPEIEFDMGASPGQNWTYSATTFENTFQLTEQGEYWADLGFFAEYQRSSVRGQADQINFGPLAQKAWNNVLGSGLNTIHTVNLLFGKQVGEARNDATPVALSWQSRLRLDNLFQPGFEYYGNLNNIAGPTAMTDPTHRAGPVLVGFYNMYQYGKVKYELGYLVGLNDATERGTIRWRFEYEKSF